MRKMDAMRSGNVFNLCFWLSLQAAFLMFHLPARAQISANEKPIWAKNATAFNCRRGRAPIEAPDHRTSVRTVCMKAADSFLAYALELVTPEGKRQEVELRWGANEVLWSPDSKSFLVNGGESSIGGFFVDVYRLTDSGRLEARTVTNDAQRDMVKSFPPCKAKYKDKEDCMEYARDPEWNMSGLGWSDDSSSIYVFAEVPPSSRYGGIMGQVLGYELSVPRGRILRRLSARQAKDEWGKLAAWRIHIPDPPEYEPAHAVRKTP